MAVLFWYPVKSDISVRDSVQYRALDKSRFTRYQNNTAMYNCSPCTVNSQKSNQSLGTYIKVRALRAKFRHFKGSSDINTNDRTPSQSSDINTNDRTPSQSSDMNTNDRTPSSDTSNVHTGWKR